MSAPAVVRHTWPPLTTVRLQFPVEDKLAGGFLTTGSGTFELRDATGALVATSNVAVAYQSGPAVWQAVIPPLALIEGAAYRTLVVVTKDANTIVTSRWWVRAAYGELQLLLD